MIRGFINGDQARLKPNRFSEWKGCASVFNDAAYEKYTLEDEGEIKCILCWTEYAPKCFAIFFLMPDGVAMRYARQLKKFLDKATARLNPKTCITYSFDCDLLNRWHEFFGFVNEPNGSKIIDGQSFNKWVIKWA